MQKGYLRTEPLVLVGVLLTLYSCSVSIEGAPCDPERNNCPEGQYCTSEGICRRGSPELRDIGDIKDDQPLQDIEIDAGDGLSTDGTELLEDILTDATTEDISSLDAGVEDIIDTGDGGADAGGCPGGCGSNASCVNGECVCDSGYRNCNNDWGDGCEVDLNSLSTCGSGCDSIVNCSTLPNVRTARCEEGLCVIGECKSGYDNCDDRVENGCEANLATDPEHCGSCTISCGENSICNNKVCACEIEYENCNNLWSDGCEVNVTNDVNNCGSCGNICDVPNADEICVDSVCQIDNCIFPYKDDDGQYDNGCEVWEYFPKTYGGSGDDLAFSIQQTTDGGYIVAGHTGSFGAGSLDLWVLKLNSNGVVEWQRSYGGSSNDSGYPIIRQTTDGGYIVAGATASFGAGSWDLWVLKLNSSGQVIWQRSYGGDAYDYARSIQETTDGGYIVAGNTESFGADSGDFWVLKLNSNGVVEWQRRYGGSNNDRAHSIRQTTDGGYIVAGATASFGASNYDFWVLKLDSSGVVEWQRGYGGSDYDAAYSIQQTTDGGYIVAGWTNSFWVLKLKSNGDIEWQRRYGGSGDDKAYSIQETTDGGYIVAGYTSSFGAGNADFWVLKLDKDGKIVWQRSYGGSGDDKAHSIQEITEGGYIVAGWTNSFGAGNNDFWVLKLNSDGSVDGNCPSGVGATTNATIEDTFATTTTTEASANQTSGAEGSTSAAVRGTNATTDTQCTAP